jgi:hypothetical protein
MSSSNSIWLVQRVDTALFLLWFSFLAVITAVEEENVGVPRSGKLQKEDMWLSRLTIG